VNIKDAPQLKLTNKTNNQLIKEEFIKENFRDQFYMRFAIKIIVIVFFLGEKYENLSGSRKWKTSN
jgi:hypothetical protein